MLCPPRLCCSVSRMSYIPPSHCSSLFKGHPEVSQVPPAQSPTWQWALMQLKLQRKPKETTAAHPIKISWAAEMGRNEEEQWLCACQSLITVWKEPVMLLGSYIYAAAVTWRLWFYILEPLSRQGSPIPLFSTLLGGALPLGALQAWLAHQSAGWSDTKHPLKGKLEG